MSTPATSSKPFKVGTTGWTVRDLLDPRIEAQWHQGRFEIIEGVLTAMSAAYYYSNVRLRRLIRQIERHLEDCNVAGAGEFAMEIDVALTEDRVVCADAVYLTTEEARRQSEELSRRGDYEDEFAPLFVTPSLVIESISQGHERHDRVTKRRWYADAGVRNYWLLDVPRQTLECLVLDGAEYRVDQAGEGDGEVRPEMFPGLTIRLADVWRPEAMQ